MGQLQKLNNKEKGYNEFLEHRIKRALPLCFKSSIKIITNMGAANPLSAAKVVKKIALELGIEGLKIAAVLGDDIFSNISKYMDHEIQETGEKLESIRSKIISANAYIGTWGIIEALRNGADIIITGRIADPALTLAPLMFEFNWNKDNYELLGKGTLAGHLLECAGQVTGGYFADPGYKDVPDIWNLGFPIAEVTENGEIVITKLEQSGGIVNEQTCKEQVLYEIHDPSSYFTPDVIADFSELTIEKIGVNKVLIKKAHGRKETGLFKVSVGYKDCYIGEGEISYGGSGAYERAKLASDIIKKRLEYLNIKVEELRIDFIGVNSLYKNSLSEKLGGYKNNYNEVRVRIAARTSNKEFAEIIGNEVEALYTNGPAGGGGARKYIKEIISIASIFVSSDDINIKVIYEEV